MNLLITPSNSNNTQYTHDTMVPVSKNFLKKTLIKNEAQQKARDEIIELYQKALEKKNTQKKQIEYVKKEPSLTEQYKIFERIKFEKDIEREIIKTKNEKKLEIIKKIEDEKIKSLQNFEEYKNYEKECNLWDKIYIKMMNNKKIKALMYKDIIEFDQTNKDINIDIYNFITGKN